MNDVNKKRILALFLLMVFIFIAAPVYAADIMDLKALGGAFKMVNEAIHKTYVAYGIMMVLIYMMVYASMSAGAKRLKIFEGDGGLNRSGKLFCIGASLSVLMALFYKVPPNNVAGFLENIFSVLGSWGGFLLGAVFGVVGWYTFKDHETFRTPIGFIAAGFALMLHSAFTDGTFGSGIGMLFFWIGLILFIVNLFRHTGLGQTADNAFANSRLGQAINHQPLNPRQAQQQQQQTRQQINQLLTGLENHNNMMIQELGARGLVNLQITGATPPNILQSTYNEIKHVETYVPQLNQYISSLNSQFNNMTPNQVVQYYSAIGSSGQNLQVLGHARYIVTNEARNQNYTLQ